MKRDDLKIRIKIPDEIRCDRIHSPAGPDSSDNKHRGHGYGIQIMETYVEADAAAGVAEAERCFEEEQCRAIAKQLIQHPPQTVDGGKYFMPIVTD